ncbi:hypothetical protein [Rhodoferax sp.]|uniref:hypothetical protein n=1 Tax=Rhodoferax sp. TaxID=50421 RepID=UPI0026248A0E|nr:hypothetical protein [Rhodoferax sp.]MDD5479661.1 hypothetical protein [Rhodoferax sp.]
MTNTNIDVLLHVAQRGNCTFTELFTRFAEGLESEPDAATRFRKKLNYLVSIQKLKRTMRDKSAWYSLGELAGKPGASAIARPVMATQADDAVATYRPMASYNPAALVPPRQNDVMHCPAYVPPKCPPTRTGALDHRRHASYGYLC